MDSKCLKKSKSRSRSKKERSPVPDTSPEFVRVGVLSKLDLLVEMLQNYEHYEGSQIIPTTASSPQNTVPTSEDPSDNAAMVNQHKRDVCQDKRPRYDRILTSRNEILQRDRRIPPPTPPQTPHQNKREILEKIRRKIFARRQQKGIIMAPLGMKQNKIVNVWRPW